MALSLRHVQARLAKRRAKCTSFANANPRCRGRGWYVTPWIVGNDLSIMEGPALLACQNCNSLQGPKLKLTDFDIVLLPEAFAEFETESGRYLEALNLEEARRKAQRDAARKVKTQQSFDKLKSAQNVRREHERRCDAEAIAYVRANALVMLDIFESGRFDANAKGTYDRVEHNRNLNELQALRDFAVLAYKREFPAARGDKLYIFRQTNRRMNGDMICRFCGEILLADVKPNQTLYADDWQHLNNHALEYLAGRIDPIAPGGRLPDFRAVETDIADRISVLTGIPEDSELE